MTWRDHIELRLEAAVSPGRALRWGPLDPTEVDDSRLDNGRVWGPWAFEPGPYPEEGLWVDITESVFTLQWTGGAIQSDTTFPRWECAQLRAEFVDPGLVFDPTNPLSPYASRLGPNVPIRLRGGYRPAPGEPATEFVTLFGGFVDTFTPGWNAQPEARTTMLVASDGVKILAGFDTNALESPVGTGELASTRISRILDRSLWPTEQRDILVGGWTMKGTDHAQPAWTELLLTADSDLGYLKLDPGGSVVYRPGEWVRARLADPQPVAEFGLPEGFDVMIAAEPEYTLDGVRNIVEASNGSTTATRADDYSIERYRASSYRRFDLMMNTGANVGLWADQVLSMGRNPKRHVARILLDPARDPGSFRYALYPGILDVWRINWTPPGSATAHTVTENVVVNGWVHTVDNDEWETVVSTGILPEIASPR